MRDKDSTGVVNAFFTSLGTAATPLPRTYSSLPPLSHSRRRDPGATLVTDWPADRRKSLELRGASIWAKWGAHSGLAGMTLAATGAAGFVALANRALIKQIR